MDPTRNPFSPGAGARPPELAGRELIVESATIALQRIARGRQEKSQMLLGLRGVGKTVLLNRIAQIAEEMGAIVVTLEAPEGQRLAAFLAPALKAVLLRLSRVEQARDLAQRALGALRGFASAFTVSIGEIDVAIAAETVADSGNLEVDLPELMACVGRAAQAAKKTVVILLDEVQYLAEEDLRGLIVAMHRMAQRGWPVILFGAGLPQVAALAGEAKSYAERLFDYPEVGPLSPDAARSALQEPIEEESEAIEDEALNKNPRDHGGLPLFPAGVGQAFLEYRQAIADQGQRCRSGQHPGQGGPGQELLPGALRSAHTTRAGLPACHGVAGCGPPSIRRYRRCVGDQRAKCRPVAQRLDPEGHDLEPCPWADRLHCADV